MAEGPTSPANRVVPAAVLLNSPRETAAPSPLFLSDTIAKDAMIAWFRGEFAAANAIIDALCGHLVQVLGGSGSDYDAVMAAIHRRRLNWIPVLQMQKYHSIAEVTVELQKLAAKRLEKVKDQMTETESAFRLEGEKTEFPENATESEEIGEAEMVDEESPNSDITETGSGEEHAAENITICSNHEEDCCDSRTSLIKLTKRFAAKEQIKGHMVNVVKGLKLYEDVFTRTELSRLLDFVNELQVAGRNSELAGETFILFNKQTKGNRRELIQLGVPIFGHATDEHSVSIEPIPALLQSVVDHLVQWRIMQEYKRPNGCVINFFDEHEHSQPFQKPPHLDQPISTLVLSESTMAFGHRLGVNNDGNFRGSLTLSLKEGSLLVMRGNSVDMARHVMCPSPNKRVSITFFKVKPESNQFQPPQTNPDLGVMTLWQPGAATTPQPRQNSVLNPYGPMVLRTPMVMLAPTCSLMPKPERLNAGGTGVFLPWTSGPRKSTKHLPPRVQKLRLLSPPSVGDDTSTEIGVS